MRSALTYISLGLGVFAVALGLVLRLYTYPQLAKMPLDLDSLSVATGTADRALVFVANGPDEHVPEFRDNLPITSTTKVTADPTAPEMEEGGDVAAYIEATKIVATDNPDIGPLSASVRQLCVDRHTGEAVAPCETQFTETDHTGDKEEDRVEEERDRVQQPGFGFKLPFDTEKTTYPWYDLRIKDTVDLTFQREDTVKDLDVYQFAYHIEPQRIGSREVPGSLLDEPDTPSIEADLYYEADRTMWIDPVTGAVIALEQSVTQKLVRDDEDYEDGTIVFDGTLALDDETVTKNVADAEESGGKLWLLTTLPIILWVVGGVLIAVAVVLLLRSREPRPEAGNHRLE
ncbi:DUF3068 domain-containing protein [Haloechinothrix salitolerans]|uniref:DUF3068 domain-containing protein n=1 Tax=Haloechinothrix salitolerans TaxID=926830 RepID=A0ABW2BRJ7_9PSEU